MEVSPLINEAFLVCALALHPIAFVPPREVHKNQITFAKFLHQEGRLLIVGGDKDRVLSMRNAGIRAFGVAIGSMAEKTPRHVVAYHTKLPFLPAVFRSVYWHHVDGLMEPHYDQLLEALLMIEPLGFFVYSELDYPWWRDALRSLKWYRLPFMLGQLSIYQNMLPDDNRLRNDTWKKNFIERRKRDLDVAMLRSA